MGIIFGRRDVFLAGPRRCKLIFMSLASCRLKSLDWLKFNSWEIKFSIKLLHTKLEKKKLMYFYRALKIGFIRNVMLSLRNVKLLNGF